MTKVLRLLVSVVAVCGMRGQTRTWLTQIESASALQRGGFAASALPECESALEGAKQAKASPSIIEGVQIRCSMILIDLDRLAEAEALVREVLGVRQARLGPEHVDTATALHLLGHLLLSRGVFAEGLRATRTALRVFTRELPADHPAIRAGKVNFAEALIALGEAKRAETILRSLVNGSSGSPPGFEVAVTLGSALAGQGKLEEAAAAWENALALCTGQLGEANAGCAAVMELGGLVALELGRFERAATLLEGTLTLVQSHHGHPVNSPALVASIGYAHFKTGRATQAEEELSDALQQMASLQPEGDETTSLTAKWLSEVLQARGAKWESKKILAKYPPKAAPIQRRQSATVSFSDLVPRKKVR